MVTGGVGSITSVSFTGSGGICNTFVATSLAWTITATSTIGVTISGYALNTPFAHCSSGTINASYNNATHALQYANQSLPGGRVV